MKTTWTRKEVAKITGIPERRVLYYTEQPLLIPGVKTDVGRGTAREYDQKAIFYLLLIKELDSVGLSLSVIRSLVKAIWLKTMDRPTDMEFMGKKLDLWVNGKFTEKPIILIISLNDEGKGFSFGIEEGKTEITIRVDRTKIVLNLNQIFKKSGL